MQGKAGVAGTCRAPCITALPKREMERLPGPSNKNPPNIVSIPTNSTGGVMPDGGARSATLERMTALSLTGAARWQISCADHSGFMPVMDTYSLAVASPLSLLTFFAAAKKVSAAPHRGITNRPLTKQGKANALRTRTSAAQAKKLSNYTRYPPPMPPQNQNPPTKTKHPSNANSNPHTRRRSPLPKPNSNTRHRAER
jgi:hypothetical protein